MASSVCTCSTSTRRYSYCSLHNATAAGNQDGEAGLGAAGQAGGIPSDGDHHPHLGTVARRALFSSKNRRGTSRRARSKDAGSLPSRLSKMTVAEEVED
ncbi:hypothetical protein ACLOJK_026386 [Asimina triloba]